MDYYLYIKCCIKEKILMHSAYSFTLIESELNLELYD